MNRDHSIPLSFRHPQYGRILGNAGIVDQYMDRPELLMNTGHCGVDARAFSNVDLESESPAPQYPALLSHVPGGGEIDIEDGYIDAILRQPQA